MDNRDEWEDDKHSRTACKISAAEVARETIFPKHTHDHRNDKVERGGCGCGLNSHLRKDDGALASPSEPADPSCRGNSLLECGVDVFAGSETYGKDGSRPTNPNYRMIDPDDDSADTAKS